MSAMQSLPEPFSRIQIEVDPGPHWIAYYARGTPEDLVASAIAKQDWIPAWPGGKQKQLPDGGHCFWVRRGKKARTWKLAFYFKTVEAARRMPGVPVDIAFEAQPKPPEPTFAERHPDKQQSATEWRAWMMRRLPECPASLSNVVMSWRYKGVITSYGERFAVDPQDAAQLAALYARFESEFVERFATARIIDRQAAAPGLRLVVDNTRPKEVPH